MSVAKERNAVSSKNEKKTLSWLLFFILFILVFILIAYYFSEIKKEFILLEKVKPYWLIAAISGQFMTYLFTALIYQLLLKTYRLSKLPGLWNLLKASIVSLFFNQTMPSAGISGNTYFFNFLARYNISRTLIISLILGELLIFYAAMEIIIISLLTACMIVYNSFIAFKTTLATGLVVYLVFGTIITLAGRKNTFNRLYEKVKKTRWINNIFEKISKRLPDNTIPEKEIQLSKFMTNNRANVVNAFFLQLLVVASDGFTLYALFSGLGHPVSPFIILLVLICTKIISLVPFLPGSLILYESSMSIFFANAGVPVGTAIIVTLLYRLLSFWLPMPIGTLFYRAWLKNSSAPI